MPVRGDVICRYGVTLFAGFEDFRDWVRPVGMVLQWLGSFDWLVGYSDWKAGFHCVVSIRPVGVRNHLTPTFSCTQDVFRRPCARARAIPVVQWSIVVNGRKRRTAPCHRNRLRFGKLTGVGRRSEILPFGDWMKQLFCLDRFRIYVLAADGQGGIGQNQDLWDQWIFRILAVPRYSELNPANPKVRQILILTISPKAGTHERQSLSV